ncbi:amino acid ABC transporter ATP-binding/permease protein [Microaceticoccus formicicus]|uniref:amino acid ABC transporter ATP-binding/permease protein n=1 Tax=Microaceticoccus formicicus TaxID=3118105 RepID=UPI003CD02585|nr:ABC transporter ATP-binding protein [Peptoniphilaceae bacterium AMB_02]
MKSNRTMYKIGLNLIGIVKPLMGQMFFAILLGTLGHISATLIPVLGVVIITDILGIGIGIGGNHLLVFVIMLALLRGIFRYGEQYLNHYIAFKLLALIRDKVFYALRRLCPAKLEGKDKGDLISLITSDIELLEVFYAHTISPIAIAIAMAIIVASTMASFHPLLALASLTAHFIVGGLIPVITARLGGDSGIKYRTGAGELSAFTLDSLRGLNETLQYSASENRQSQMRMKTDELLATEKKMKESGAIASAITQTTILGADLIFLFIAAVLYIQGNISFSGLLISQILIMSSFGPFISLANLGSGLQNTFAAANRILDILEEDPVCEDIGGLDHRTFNGAKALDISFSYDDELILDGISADFPKGEIIGIHGKSGSGKSTLLKLLMRFWKVDDGEIVISGETIENINTQDLRDMESYVTQETHLFSSSISDNLRIAKRNASQSELEEACKKASVHDFIAKLPSGYETKVGELGDRLSGGERQRIGLARAFLHGAPLVLLDEPTSNLDSLNEAVILKSVVEEKENRTVILVTHRESTMSLADRVYSVEHGRVS